VAPLSEQPATSRTEKWVSLCVLAALVAVAVGWVWVQFRFNPAVTARQAAAIDAVPPAIMRLAALAPADVTPLSPPEQFDTATLSDKIDGKAELYFSAGFRSLTAQRFSRVGHPAQWFELFVYDMGTARNAFSVFSMQRRGDTRPHGPAAFGYATPNGRFLAHGPYYVELIGAHASEPLMAAADAMVDAFAARIPANGADIPEMACFPGQGLAAGTRSLVASDAFGIAGFNQVFTAAYQLDAATATAYVARRDSEPAARSAAKAIRDFYLEFGGTVLPGPEGMTVIDILDTIEIVFYQGRYVAGVHEAADASSALTLAERLKVRLGEIGHGGS